MQRLIIHSKFRGRSSMKYLKMFMRYVSYSD